MSRSFTLSRAAAQELRFWACFAVVVALLSQALFPLQALAFPGRNGDPAYTLCTGTAEKASESKAEAAGLKSKSSGFMGLMCANCALAAVTSLEAPPPVTLPVVYRSLAVQFARPSKPGAVRSRAPPRPHSCGPPSQISA